MQAVVQVGKESLNGLHGPLSDQTADGLTRSIRLNSFASECVKAFRPVNSPFHMAALNSTEYGSSDDLTGECAVRREGRRKGWGSGCPGCSGGTPRK